MKKQLNRNLFKTVLLLVASVLMVTLLCVSLLLTVYGDEKEKKTLTLQWSDGTSSVWEHIESITVKYILDNGSDGETQTFKRTDVTGESTQVSMEIPVGSEVTVKIVPVPGYLLKDLTVTAGTYAWVEKTQTLTWTKFNADNTVEMKQCEERTYKITVVNYNAVNSGISYGTDDTFAWKALFNGDLTYTYGGDSLVLPEVKMTGYTFQGWRVRTGMGDDFSDNDETSQPLTANTINQLIVGNNTYAQNTGELYIYPRMEPTPQTFYRYDYVYSASASQNNYRGAQLSDRIQGTALINSKITGLVWMDDDDEANGVYKTYAGYVVHVCNEFCSAANAHYPDVTINDSDEVENVVVRLYEAIVYRLTFLNAGDDYTPFSNTYLYGNRTEIKDPTRFGYTFNGWTVEVYKNGEWKTVDSTDPGFCLGDKNATIGNDPNALYASDKNEDAVEGYEYEIRLTARWSPNSYTIDYDFGGVTREEDVAYNDSLPKQFTFDSVTEEETYALAIALPKRAGYRFCGWSLSYLNDGMPVTETFTPEENEAFFVNGTFLFPSNQYASNVTLTAAWEAMSYTVILSGNGATVLGTASLTDVQFDQLLQIPSDFELPARDGYTFLGYWSTPAGSGEQYIDADGNAVEGKLWGLFETNADGNIVLYARWKINPYCVDVELTLPIGLNASDVSVFVSQKDGNGNWGDFVLLTEPMWIDYGTEYRVRISIGKKNFKVVQWGHKESETQLTDHVSEFESNVYTVGAENIVWSAIVLSSVNDPTGSVTVDYRKETMSGLPAGKYLLYLGELYRYEITVTVNGTQTITTVNGEQVTAIPIPNAFFGSTAVRLIRYGDGETTADSDPYVLTFVARPEAPANDVYNVNPNFEDHLEVEMNEGIDVNDYEFAVWIKGDASLLPEELWGDLPNDLRRVGTGEADLVRPGTRYYVFVRKKATDEAPHGEVYVTDPRTTMSANYLKNYEDYLDGLLDGYGENVKSLVDEAKETIRNAQNPETFYETIENAIAKVKAGLELAQVKDTNVARLEKKLQDCVASGSYSDENIARLQGYYSQAVERINQASSVAQVQELFRNADDAMDAVPLSYLYVYDMEELLLSLIGKAQTGGFLSGSGLELRRQMDFDTIAKNIDAAIRSGSITVGAGGTLTAAEAQQLLKELEVVAHYNFRMLRDNATVQPDGAVEIRLTIPKDLKACTGLRVAYYHSDTGMIELLNSDEVVQDGNELVFYTDKVADFVILADATVELTGVIIALGVVLLCQLIAICAILIGRMKAKKHSVACCTVLPMAFLTVRFSPVHADLLVLVMGLLAVVLQGILLALLFSSHLTHRRRSKRAMNDVGKHVDDGASEQMEQSESSFSVSEEIPEEAFPNFDEDPDIEDVEVPEDFDETEEVEEPLDSLDDMETESDPYATYDTAYEDEEEFIEPSPVPRYSMDEDAEEDGSLFAYGETDEADSEVFDDEDVYQDSVTDEMSEDDATESSDVASFEWDASDVDAESDDSYYQYDE